MFKPIHKWARLGSAIMSNQFSIKNETILDPACGTAGFLISSYKHILNQNTKKNLGDELTASDRKKIGENLNGYDISPDMVKMSLVNMYLHFV